jgi:exopolyphosphatase/guanosine-5'-triphosphate,3'-diphosphate pyrophosphatase
MQVSKAAMREGILYDMIGRGGEHDPRDSSVDALMVRYAIDKKQAKRVEDSLMHLFDQVAKAWSLDADDRLMLARAARLHELGLVIAHSQYHVHGSYVVENSDIAGFSQQQQRFLAALIRTHRRNIPKSAFDAVADRLLTTARRSAALLRLAVLLHRSHENGEIPRLDLKADGAQLMLTVSKRWLDARPLVKADLDGEPEDMAGLGIQLSIVAA